jgi:hypothetical protein
MNYESTRSQQPQSKKRGGLNRLHTPQAFANNGYSIYTSNLSNKHEFGTGFFVDSKVHHLVTNFTPINERLCLLSKKGRFFNYTLINKHAQTNGSNEEAKDQFSEDLERA